MSDDKVYNVFTYERTASVVTFTLYRLPEVMFAPGSEEGKRGPKRGTGESDPFPGLPMFRVKGATPVGSVSIGISGNVAFTMDNPKDNAGCAAVLLFISKLYPADETDDDGDVKEAADRSPGAALERAFDLHQGKGRTIKYHAVATPTIAHGKVKGWCYNKERAPYLVHVRCDPRAFIADAVRAGFVPKGVDTPAASAPGEAVPELDAE